MSTTETGQLTSHDSLLSVLSTLKSLMSPLYENKSLYGCKRTSLSMVLMGHLLLTHRTLASLCLVWTGAPISYFRSSLPNTTLLIDQIFEYLSSRAMDIKDLFRLGKCVNPAKSEDQTRSVPVIVEFSSTWDKRLVLFSK